jgi:DNA-binding NarL/FixJ family response regulator
MVMTAARPIRILVADDHPLFRSGVAAMIGQVDDLQVAGEARTGLEAVEQYFRHRPDVALVDLRMPEMEGVEVIAAIRQRDPDARLIVLTTYDSDEDIYRGLRAGAKGYLLKDCEVDDLVRCVRAVHAGQTWLPPVVAGKLADRVTGSELTPREVEVLQHLAAGKSNKEIASACGVVEGTVKTHVNNILGKLGVGSRTEAVTLAIKRGLVRLP